jgi:hypothetical protein
MQHTTFLSGQRLAPAARLPRSRTARVPLPVVQAAAATKRLKAGSGKKKPPARKVPNMQKGTQVKKAALQLSHGAAMGACTYGSRP